MKAVFITRPGPPEVLEVRDLPDPQCGPEQLRVRVRAAGSPQEVPGLEFGREIESLGGVCRVCAEARP